MKNIDKKTLITIGLVVMGIVTTVIVAAVAVPRVLVTLTKAAPATKVSIKDSYVLGEVILAKADGEDKNVVNVFVLDASGKGVQGKNVEIEAQGLVEGNEFKISDTDGKAKFEITSKEEGQYEVGASVEGIPLNRTIKVTFRN